MKKPMPERVCGAKWISLRPEAVCQLEHGHEAEHYFKNYFYSVSWTSNVNADSQKKIKLRGE